MNREAIYEIIIEETDLTDEDLEAMLDNDLITILLNIGKDEENGLETDIDWDYVRNELNGMDWYESDGGFDEERQIFLGPLIDEVFNENFVDDKPEHDDSNVDFLNSMSNEELIEYSWW